MLKGLMVLLLVYSCFGSLSPSAVAMAQDRWIPVGEQHHQSREPGRGSEEERRKTEERRRREEEKRKKEEEERRRREEEKRKKEEEERRRREEEKNNAGRPAPPQSNPTSPPSNPANPSRPPAGKPQEQRSYYGQVTLNASGQVRSGDTLVQSNSPWLALAAPGMWLEASGNWEGNTFEASEVKLHSPQSWSYYQGPAALVGASGYQSVAAWLSTNRQDPFIALKAAPESSEVRLVAYFDGSKLRATPSGFPAPPAGLAVGWVELIGKVGSGGLVWVSVKAFP
jgi:hypothetical protein